MFTGIIETIGEIIDVQSEGANRHFKVRSVISDELSVDQSVSHQGVCLTVTKLEEDAHWVTAIDESLEKSNADAWAVESKVNLERCMKADGRFDGHIVQGHVDATVSVSKVQEKEGSWIFTFSASNTKLIVEKGSVCLNGTSLTCFDVTDSSFTVAIIPFTYEHTTFSELSVGDEVNIEFDILGKYVQKMMNR
ncbi:MAG: riboflavin synthase [Cytophagales bacterium]|nr:riboflavin synthase [Cytophagales bacterium]